MMHIFSPKAATKHKPIATMQASARLFLPLAAHRGQAALPIVEVGDYVQKYQCLAKPNGDFSIYIYAPCSGKIAAIENIILPNGKTSKAIILDNDFKEKNAILPFPKLKLSTQSTRQDLVDFIALAGIVGQGGAQFPTHIKYNIGNTKLDTLIINGAECEPYLTADYSLLQQKSQDLIHILHLLHAILQPNKIVLAVEKQNKEVLKPFQILEKNNQIGFSVKILPNEYPQGSELQLIKAITNKVLKKGVLPISQNILVSNVGTLMAMAQAQLSSYPIIDRVLTVSGDNMPTMGNYKVLIGTPIHDILSNLNLEHLAEERNILIGGPMMGDYIENTQIAIHSGVGGLLLLNKKQPLEYNCIGCGYCVEVCPMGLMPLEFAFAYEEKNKQKMQDFNLSVCIECAACQYICPSNVSLIESIKRGKIDFLKI